MGNDSPINRFFRNKWTKLITAIDVVILVVIIIVAIDNAQKNATIKIY